MVTLRRSPKSSVPPRDGERLTRHQKIVVPVSLLAGVMLGGVAYLLHGAGSEDAASLTTTQVATSSTRSAASGTAGASSTSPAGESGQAPTQAPGRDPFAGAAASTGGAPSTAPTTPPTTAPTSSPSATSSPTGTSARTTTVTVPGPAVTTTRVTTVTATASARYLGLYGWTADGLPEFRVNETSATPEAGETFASSLVYQSSYVSDGVTCATVVDDGTTRSICPGEVLKLS